MTFQHRALAALVVLSMIAGACARESLDPEESPPVPTTAGAIGFDALQSGPEPPPVMISPAGERIVSGTVDELGWTLPLDVRRPRAPRPLPGPPAREAIDEARAERGPGLFPETRLGPDDGHTQNETSIDIDGAVLVAGWNNVEDSGGVMGVARSVDRGRSWSWGLLTGHSIMSDPAVAAAGGGVWYFGYLGTDIGGSDIEIYVRRSDDDGATWQSAVAVTANTIFDDKPYIAARGQEVLVAWADFTSAPSTVRAARSLDGGQTFAFDTILSVNSMVGNAACPIIAPNGSYHVMWRDSFQNFFWISTSTDQGQTWSADASIVAMNPLPTPLPPGFRTLNAPTCAVDPVTGDLLVVFNDQLFGNPDILAIRSTDDGANWSAPVRVNDDAGTAAQFFPWVSFDETGTAYAMWYDRRNDATDIDVYIASSTDGGATWSANTRVTATGYTPVLPWEGGAANFIGDYNSIAASAGQIYPFYQDAREGNQDVWVATIPGFEELFEDGFEAGDISAWTTSEGAGP